MPSARFRVVGWLRSFSWFAGIAAAAIKTCSTFFPAFCRIAMPIILFGRIAARSPRQKSNRDEDGAQLVTRFFGPRKAGGRASMSPEENQTPWQVEAR